EELAAELGLFSYSAKRCGEIKVNDADINAIRERILSPRYHFGAPRIGVTQLRTDGTLDLKHDAIADGRGLDTEYARKVLEYVHCVWRRPVEMHTLDERNRETVIKVGIKSH
ncbi:MAG: SpoVR family protein, partial [Gammaproteobacteria bacterium]